MLGRSYKSRCATYPRDIGRLTLCTMRQKSSHRCHEARNLPDQNQATKSDASSLHAWNIASSTRSRVYCHLSAATENHVIPNIGSSLYNLLLLSKKLREIISVERFKVQYALVVDADVRRPCRPRSEHFRRVLCKIFGVVSIIIHHSAALGRPARPVHLS